MYLLEPFLSPIKDAGWTAVRVWCEVVQCWRFREGGVSARRERVLGFLGRQDIPGCPFGDGAVDVVWMHGLGRLRWRFQKFQIEVGHFLIRDGGGRLNGFPREVSALLLRV